MTNHHKNATVLGLSAVLEKKKTPRDLDDLVSLDMTKGVEYPTPATSKPQESISVVPAAVSFNPIGIINGTGLLRLPDGNLVKFESRLIAGDDLTKVTVYPGNPRATSNPDVTSLRVKIALTGGNIIPVIARQLNDGSVEVIAGSRRTAAVRAEKLQLMANVIIEEISDVNATALAFYENDERNDPDVFDQAEYFSKTYETYRNANLVKSIDDFSNIFGMSKANMSRYLNIATIPDWVIKLCPRTLKDPQGTVTNMWSLRKALELLTIFNQNLTRIDSELEFQLSLLRIEDPEHLIRALMKTLNKTPTVNAKTSLTVEGANVGYVESGKRKNTLKIYLSEDAPEDIVNEIKRLLEALQS